MSVRYACVSNKSSTGGRQRCIPDSRMIVFLSFTDERAFEAWGHQAIAEGDCNLQNSPASVAPFTHRITTPRGRLTDIVGRLLHNSGYFEKASIR